MFDKLEAVEQRYEEVTKMISDPEVISNQSEWQKLMKEHALISQMMFLSSSGSLGINNIFNSSSILGNFSFAS